MERTLEEAIKYYSELAEANEKDAEQFKRLRVTQDVISYCYECAKEHRQLAEWLRELKAYREILANADKIIESIYGCVIIEGYADVIDKMNKVFRGVNADGKTENT